MYTRPAEFPRRSIRTAARLAIGAILSVALATSCTSPTAPDRVPRATSPNGLRPMTARSGHLSPDTLTVKARCDWVNPWVCR
jgi:hypothetical protein